MTISYSQAFALGSYRDDRKALLFSFENQGFIGTIHNDSANLPTIGYGFNLAGQSAAITDAMLRLAFGTGPLPAEDVAALDIIDDWRRGRAVNLDGFPRRHILTNADILHLSGARLNGEATNPLTTAQQVLRNFDLSEQQATTLLNVFLDGDPSIPRYKGTESGLDARLDQRVPGLDVPESRERLALLSLGYNSRNFSLIGQNLADALDSGDRAAAWAEIRYGHRDTQLQFRRAFEADYFGLVDRGGGDVVDQLVEIGRALFMDDARYQAILARNPVNARFPDQLKTALQPWLAEQVDGFSVDFIRPDGVAAASDPGAGRTLIITPRSGSAVGTLHGDYVIARGDGAVADGGAGPDQLRADGSGVRLLGGDGNDTLVGGAGADQLVGGNGKDLLIGGAGADLFVFNDPVESVPNNLPSTRVLLSVSDATAGEGSKNDPGKLVFHVALSRPAVSAVSFDVTLVDDTARAARTDVAGRDFVAAPTTRYTIAAGATYAEIVVTLGSTRAEPNEVSEALIARFSNLSGASFEDNPAGTSYDARGTIVDDDGIRALPIMHVESLSVAEGVSGERTIDLHVMLTAPSTSEIRVNYAATGGTATLDQDYLLPGPGTLVFAPGQTSAVIPVTIRGDTINEGDESIQLSFSGLVGAQFVTGNPSYGATVRILDDEISRRDIIYDFTPTQDGIPGDRIDLRTIDADITRSGTNPFTYRGTAAFTGNPGEIRYAASPDGTVVQASISGNGFIDFEISLKGTVALTRGSFLFAGDVGPAPIGGVIAPAFFDHPPAGLNHPFWLTHPPIDLAPHVMMV